VARTVFQHLESSPSPAGYQPATQQIDNLRYGEAWPAHARSGWAIFKGN
jgi:hypothetical protein